MRSLFNSKKSSSSPKKQPTGPENIDTSGASSPSSHHQRHHSLGSEPPSSPLRSSSAANHGSRSPKKKSSAHPASPVQSPRDRETTSKSRGSRTFGRHSTDPGSASSSSSRRHKADLNTHPLNLPPDEYKRLSALSNMSNRSSFDKMDVDRETANSSPPAAAAQSSFTVPITSPTNGTKETPKIPRVNTNGSGPVPPPHRSNPSSPVPTNEDEAESYKAAGNKFFKEKDYKNAIVQYTKGKRCFDTHIPYAILVLT